MPDTRTSLRRPIFRAPGFLRWGAALHLAKSGRRKGSAMEAGPYEVKKSEEDWQAQLTPEQYRVLREHGTERPGASPLNAEKREGRFLCAACQNELFDSATKYESGSGWPSFYAPREGAVGTTEDRTLGMRRVEVHCARCGGHLGHVFPDGPQPTGLRFCMNGAALTFKPE